MARHRNVRSMNYDEEYDGFDDVYGHSVEDDYASSPSMQHFLYDRSQGHQMSAFIQSDIPEEEEVSDPDAPDGNIPNIQNPALLNDIEKAQLNSCLDAVQDRIGNNFTEQAAINAILWANYDVDKAVNRLLTGSLPTDINTKSEMKTAKKKDNLLSSQGQDSSSSNVRCLAATGSRVTPVRVVPTKIVSTGFSLPPTTPEIPQTKQESAVEETSRQMGRTQLQTPTSIVRSTSPSEREPTPSSTSKSKSRSSWLNTASEYERERAGMKTLLNLIVIGHVDAGKSTLMGHLLYKLGQVSAKQMHKYEQESKKLGKQSFMYAWVLDETGEERSRGITMDVGLSSFETEHKAVTLLDAPGHRDFIPNMIFGTAQADVAVLVVDATTGEFETGFESGGQTREHALLVRSMGVSQLGVAVNKLDMVEWSKKRFDEISTRLGAFLKQAGFKDQDIFYVPVSGLTGENLVTPSTEPKLSSWYTGPTLLKAIDGFRSPDRALNRPTRFVISDIFKSTGSSSGCCLAGRVESGMIQVGDSYKLMPLNESAHVKNITINDSSAQGTCFAGDQVVLTISGVDPSNISLGSILCDQNQPIRVTSRIEARIVVFNIDVPITKGFPVILHYQSLSEAATICKLVSQIHKSSGEVIKKRPRCLTKQTSGVVEIEISRPICMELYKDYRELGRFMLRSGGTTIAAGLVTNIK